MGDMRQDSSACIVAGIESAFPLITCNTLGSICPGKPGNKERNANDKCKNDHANEDVRIVR